MNEKTYLGMPKNVCYGLSWLFFPLGIVTLCVERANLTKEERQHLISIFVLEGIAIVVSTFFSILASIIAATTGWVQGYLIGLPFNIFFTVIIIIAMVKAFCGNYWKVPLCYNIAAKFVKDLPQDSAEAAPAAEAEVVDAPVAEEAPAEEPKAE